MGCHAQGRTLSTTLAAEATGLSPARIDALYDTLSEEGWAVDAPSPREWMDWEGRQRDLLQRSDLSAARKDALRRQLDRAFDEPMPSGEEFYALVNIEARARQEKVINGIEGVVDLAPAGSQADQYTLGPDGRPTHVWYASYGSNLNDDRLMAYIRGGRPEGGSRAYVGCDDSTPPAADIPIRVAGYRPHFALRSRVWGGGIAFIDRTEQDDDVALGRAYLITIEQYDQIVAQENGRSPKGAPRVDLTGTLADGHETLGPGAYETNHHLGDHNGAPVVSFSAPFTITDAISGQATITRSGEAEATVNSTRPSAAYCRMIGSGLNRTFGLSEVEQADYIRGCPGGNLWARKDLVAALRTRPEPTSTWTRPTPVVTGVASRRSKGDFFHGVKTYGSREEQKSGLKRWKTSVETAQGGLRAAEAALRWHETGSTESPKVLAEAQTKVANARARLLEAEKKYQKAKDQTPPRWFSESSRTRGQWKAFARDLERDQDQAKQAMQRPDLTDRQRRYRADKYERLRSQAAEARRYAGETTPSAATPRNTQAASTPPVTSRFQPPAPEPPKTLPTEPSPSRVSERAEPLSVRLDNDSFIAARRGRTGGSGDMFDWARG